MTKYDANIIATMADRMYSQADAIIFTYTVLGAVLGFGIALVAGFALRSDDSGMGLLIFAALLSVAGGAVGLNAGRAKAFLLRFQAQQMLVMVEIERNTRGEGGKS